MSALQHFVARLQYPLDPFQLTACARLESGYSVLVAAPTGSGKTTIAEFAIELARREHDLEVIYTAPIKALSNQKYAELCVEYGSDQVALITGDVSINAKAPIRVMTTEVLRNIIYADPACLSRVHSVILDEVHFLGDRFRGPVWEEIILHLPQHIKIVGLSATVSNAEELGDWMHLVRGDTEVIISEKRPVPLYQHVLTRNALLPLYDKGKFNKELYRLQPPKRVRARGQAPHRDSKRVSSVDAVLALAETGLTPAIVFIFSRSGCDQAVSKCLYAGVSFTTKHERDKIRKAANRIVSEITPEEQKALRIRSWIRGLERGIAAHHAGLLPQQKLLVEELFQERLLKIVFATETLALGINMPAKAVIIEKLKKFNGQEQVFLTSGEFTQLTGRAGRRGIDTEGHAVILWDNNLDLELLAGLSSARSYPVISSFTPTYNMAVNLLRTRDVPQVKATLERSFAQFQADRALSGVAQELYRAKQSLVGYQQAAAKTSGDEAKRWHLRAKKLAQQIRGQERLIKRRAGGIARTFERVVTLLVQLGYLADKPSQNPVNLSLNELQQIRFELRQNIEKIAVKKQLYPTVWGAALAKIHGEKAILVTEALRRGIWNGLDPIGLVAVIGCLTYEPRRNDAGAGYQLGQDFQTALGETNKLWAVLDSAEQTLQLPQSVAPLSYNAWALDAWARAEKLDVILESSGLNAGDFLRWIKQTADTLGQISAACEAVLEAAIVDDLTPQKVKELLDLAQTARKAREKIVYGIAETTGL